jgi:hypothetical protein
MRKVNILTIALIVSLSLCATIVRLVGAAQPTPFSALFSNADGTPCQRPCMLGLRPGVTNFYAADYLLTQHPFIQGRFTRYADRTSRDLVEYVARNLRIAIAKDGQGTLASITLDFDPRLRSRAPNVESPLQAITFGEVVGLLGAPTLVMSQRGFVTVNPADRIWMYYRNDWMVIINGVAGVERLDMADQSLMLLLLAPTTFDGVWRNISTSSDFRRWIGFTAFKFYARQ